MQTAPKLFEIHARTLGGLEQVLAAELHALGAKDLRIETRAVVFQGDLELLYRVCVECRTAIRILRPLALFPAENEQQLYDGVRAIEWSKWIGAQGTLAVNAHVHSSFTSHSLFVAQLVKDGVVDLFLEQSGERPSVDLESPELRIAVNVFRNQVLVAVDASGESLHRRGYRLQTGEAPINETLAAGILALSQWDRKAPLVDPMCGSGTFVIEAALWATNRAPGINRDFGFERWSDFDAVLLDKVKDRARQNVKAAEAPILGLEIDPQLADIARQNAVRAGVQDIVRIETGDFFVWKPVSGVGTLVINPPYDERLHVQDIDAFYRRMGDRLKQSWQGWGAHIISASASGLRALGLRTAAERELLNGSIECRLRSYDLKNVQAPSKEHADRKVEAFANRLRKDFKHYGKIAKRDGLSCWRVYDWDIPELAFIVDIYGEKAHFAHVPRNSDAGVDPEPYLQAAADELGIARGNIVYKKRVPQKTGGRLQDASARTNYFEVTEGAQRYFVNLTDYLDTGLPLELRKVRAWVHENAGGKDFLNLYGYTGSLSVAAAAGGARSTMTVDASGTYLDWAQENLRLNSFEKQHRLEREDVGEFLENTGATFDLCVVDPPNRSIHRASGTEFDVRRDHTALLEKVFTRMRPGGKVLFCTSFRDLRLTAPATPAVMKDVTARLTPTDCERQLTHRFWLFELP